MKNSSSSSRTCLNRRGVVLERYRPLRHGRRPPAVLDLYRYLSADTAASYGDERPLTLAEPETILQEMSDQRGVFLLVAEDDGQVVATVSLIFYPILTHEGRSEAVLENMVTHPEVRRRGVGSALLREVDHLARERRAVKISLTSSALRKGAHRFYTTLGWRRSHLGFTLSYPGA